MTVDGRARWTCRTHVDTVARDGRLEIAPLAHLPVIRDLVVDMTPFFDKWAAAHGSFVPTATRRDEYARIAPAAPARRAVDAAIECIGCGVCYASCDVVGWKPDYLGPAALNRAWTLSNDTRDQTFLWLAQRGSAAVLALAVVVHLATMIIAVRGGLSAAEILERTRGSAGWALFYGVFVLAVAVHAPIGLRAILAEWVGLRGRAVDLALALIALALLASGLRAVYAVTRA